jgi:hypothetical protein
MAMRLRTKIALIATATAGVLLAVAIVGPRFIDVEAYKPAMQEAVKAATGRELVIEGAMRIRLFPTPRISARKVHFANAVGAKGAQMVDVQWIGASPSWLALLLGRVEVGQITLYKPVVVLETDAKGVPNWEFAPGAGAAQPAGASSTGLHLSVGTLNIRQGTLSYTHPQTGRTFKAEQIEATASVGSLDGPFAISGKATVNDVPLSLDVRVSEKKEKGHDTAFTFKVESGKLDFVGQVSAIRPGAAITGHLSVATGLLTDFIGAVVRATGEPPPPFDASVVGRFTFDGGIEVSPTRLAITDFKTTLAGDEAAGSLALTYGKQPSLDGRLALPKLDLEKWLTVLSQPGIFLPPMKAAASPAASKTAAPATSKPSAPAAQKPAPPAATPTTLSPFPPEMNVALSLDIAETLYRKGTIRDLSIAFDIRKGVITVPRFKVVLPGEMVVQADGAVKADTAAAPAAAPVTATPTSAAAKPPAKIESTGTFSLRGSNLRKTLAWLDVDTSGMPAGRLQTLTVTGKLASTAGSVNVSDATLELDGQPVKGAGALTFGPPFAVTATVDADRFDLDAYMPRRSEATTSIAAAATPAAATPAAAPPPVPDKTTPKFQLKSKIAKLVYRQETLNGVAVDATVQGNLLTLSSVTIADLLGSKIDLKGSVNDFANRPRFDLSFNAAMPDTDKLIVYAGLPKFVNGKIGAASASGGVAGTMEAVTLRDVTVAMLGATAHATGSLKFADKPQFDLSNFRIHSQDASRLVSVAAGRNQSGVGTMSASGTLKGTSDRATFNGELDVMGARMMGSLDSTLGARPNITAKLRVPGTLDIDQWLGVSANPPAATGPSSPPASPALATAIPLPQPKAGKATAKSIDLSALRSFDAKLSLETSALTIASLKVTYCDFEATVRNGVVNISKLTGQFYGGAVDFAGTIDASGQSLVVDLKGSLQGIYFGELLRGTAGTNSFGNPDLTVSVDGKITAMDIKLKGKGNSPEQIRNALTGTAGLSGFVYPAVTKGSLSFARFATSVAGVFSEGMAFNSAMLQGFINRQNPIAGQMQIGDGAVILQNQTVSGQNTTASIISRTNLESGTTDTTVNIDTGNDKGPADFVMKVQGPLSSPSLTTGRGPGR